MKIEKQNDGQIKIKITVIQKRIDAGPNQDNTSFTLVDRYGLQIVEHVNPYDIVLGTVNVIHPSLLAGTWEEFINDVSTDIVSGLIARGMAETNRYGYTYLV